MTTGQTIENDIQVNIPLVFKVDKANRTIEGIATQEVTDVHGEVVDHESMKSVLADWPGNIREMHQPIAVGKAVSVVSDDDAKATILRARISKGAPDTWEKILDGTLSMFSIGGTGKRVTTKRADGSEEKRIFMTALHETSVVDNGACPTAKFEIVKLVDGAPTEVQPAEPAPETAQRGTPNYRASVMQALTDTIGAYRAKGLQVTERAAAAVEKVNALPGDAVQKAGYPEPYDISQALTCIAYLESLLANEWWEARDEAVNGEGDAKTAQMQLELLRNAIELVMAFLLSEFDEQFSLFDEEQPAETLSAAAKAAKRIAGVTRVIEKFAAAQPVVWNVLDKTGQLWIAKAGARHSKADVQMIQAMHDSAVSLGAMCSSTEKVATPAVAKVVTETIADTTPAAPAIDPAEDLAAKAAAQHAARATGQAPKTAAVQKTEAPQPESEPVPAPPAADPGPTAAALVAQAGVAPDQIQKLVAAAIAEALTAHKATSDATIAELNARIEKLANEPAPGGPKTRAIPEGTPVHKQIGGTPQAAEAPSVDLVAKFAENLAKEATTEEERLRIATNLLRFQHATGQGAVAFRATFGNRQE